ncbi:hypothetical protein [Kitasatospora sp. NPDC057223]|uniref:hypothetical protein n=1 Tax=Kitasatospora sp. NPDC057223 TaxID=3346055 RepID=UPI00362A1B1F
MLWATDRAARAVVIHDVSRDSVLSLRIVPSSPGSGRAVRDGDDHVLRRLLTRLA